MVGRNWVHSVLTLLVLLGSLGLGGCVTSSITGKQSIQIPIPVSVDVRLGLEALDQYVDDSKVITTGPDAEMVQRVMNRLIAAAGVEGEDYEWSVRLVDEPNTVNAFALPGGPMAVYTGILPVTQTEAGLAVVMGHELGHVLERHGMNRMILSNGTSFITSLIDLGEWGQLTQLGIQYGIERPFGRSDESESDHIGIILMARAGYDPREAPKFWERMGELAGNSSGPEWMSTHPSNDRRQADLNDLLPEALAEYQSAGSGGSSDGGMKQYDDR
ncbi:MAG: putative Zn-dependent protease [Planctomycetota bacterium]|jgi:predicted Zn-dependent protease